MADFAEPSVLAAGETAMRGRLRAILFGGSSSPPRFGRYVVLGTVGHGGLGVVVRAHDPELDREVAIKVVAGGIGRAPEVQERLRREARALARLSHPNVVAVHDVGMHDGELFLAMELVDGRTLTHWARERERSWSEIRDVLVGAARGLAAAHRVDLVHRDVKPANILVDREERARVLDFGLARAVADGSAAPVEASTSMRTDLTEDGTVMGTPAYMAPEQLAGATVDARTDQWGFCVTAWELLYGARPFPAADFTELRARVCSGEPPVPPRRGDVPSRLHRAIERGLARDPAERWSDMDALADALVRDPSSRARGRVSFVVGALALASIVVGAAWINGARDGDCTGRVRVSGFHAQWSTPNAIRWAWTLDEGDVDTLQEYRVTVGPTEPDVESRSDATRAYTSAENPELAFRQLPGTTGRDLVDGTISDGLAPDTEYSAQLSAIDNLDCESTSNLATERTPPVPKRTIDLFKEELRGTTFPPALGLVDDASRAFAGSHYLEYRSADDPECTGEDALCFQNLRLVDLGLPARLGEAAGKHAYLELALRAETTSTPYWANVMLRYGEWATFDAWTVRPSHDYRIVQVPLRVIVGPDGLPSADTIARHGITGFTIGGQWGFGATIAIDDVRVRY